MILLKDFVDKKCPREYFINVPDTCFKQNSCSIMVAACRL